jgi:signal transduction histidine kinase
MEFLEFSIKNLRSEIRGLEDEIEALSQILEMDQLEFKSATNEEKKQLAADKSFLKFLFELNFTNDIDELFSLFRKELKHRHQLGEPIFLFFKPSPPHYLYTFQGPRLHKRKLNWTPDISQPERLHQEVKKKLVDEITRPLADTFCFPLNVPSFGKISPHSRVWFLVDSLNGEFTSDDLSWIEDRIQVFDFALDRKLLEERARSLAHRWKKTFDDFKDPICIKNLSGEIIRANQAFFLCSDFSGYISKTHNLSHPQTGQDLGRIEFYIFERDFENMFKLEAQNEKMAALGKLAGNLSHELNNPLTGIKSMAQVLLSEESGEESPVAKDLQEVLKAVQRCQKIISNLTRFSLKRDSELDLEEKTYPDEGIDAVMTLLKARLRSFYLDVDLQTSGSWIRVPPQLFQQVMFNILHNACQAMRDGQRLRIQSRLRNEETRAIVLIEIEDSGPGIPASLQHQIFEPFFTTKLQGEGTGLGLYLSKSIVEKFHGKLYFRDKGQSSGTIFFVEFPVAGQKA